MPKQLNFFPYYRDLLKKGTKKTTIRLGIKSEFKKNDLVTLTIGWSEDNSERIREARITSVTTKRIKDLSEMDLLGESPDCYQKSAVKYVLSAIYRKIVQEEDFVTIIKWRNLEEVG